MDITMIGLRARRKFFVSHATFPNKKGASGGKEEEDEDEAEEERKECWETPHGKQKISYAHEDLSW